MRLDPITLNQGARLLKAITTKNFFQIGLSGRINGRESRQVTSGTHSALEPRLPIPNRTVKRGCADDSVHAYAKVGQCQTSNNDKAPVRRGFVISAFSDANFSRTRASFDLGYSSSVSQQRYVDMRQRTNVLASYPAPLFEMRNAMAQWRNAATYKGI